MAYEIPQSFYDTLGRIESGNRPYVKAKTSSASGLFQFVKSTWQDMGGTWGSDGSKAFGGLTPSVSEQTAMVQKLTQQNAGLLDKSGISLSPSSLYAAHFLGAGTAKVVLAADPNTQVSDLVKSSVIKANPFLANMSAGDFMNWLVKKTGSNAPFTGGGSGNASGTFRGRKDGQR